MKGALEETLPFGWLTAPIIDVTIEKVDQVVPNPDSNFVYIDISSIDNKSKIITDPKRLPGKDAPSRARQVVKSADVLVSMTRPNLNAVAILPDFLDKSIASTGFDVLRTVGIEAQWLFYNVKSRAFIEAMTSRVQGALYPAIRPSDIRNYWIHIPPINEQKRIIARIEELQASSRRAREALESIPDLLDQLRQSILAAAFRGDLTKEWRESHPNIEPATELLKRIRAERRKRWEEAELEKLKAKGLSGGKLQEAFASRRKQYKEPAPVDTTDLPEIPEKWCWASCGELLYSIAYGTAKKSYYGNEGIGVLRIPNILPNGSISIEDLKRSVFNDTELVEYELHEGDILIIRSNGSLGIVGRTAVVGKLEAGLTYAGYLLRLIPSSLVNSHWLQLALSTPAMRIRIETMSRSTSGVNNINSDEVSSLPIPLAPQVEQKHIALAVRNQLNCLQMIDAKQLDLFTLLDNLDQSILSKAFRGELVPQDPSDEPASIILERIRQEKARAVTEPKIKDRRNRGVNFQ